MKHAPSLFILGYQVVPVVGAKPLIKEYSKKTFSIKDAKQWERRFPDANIALCAGQNNVYVLDFDIDTLKLSQQIIRRIKKRWKGIPIRFCNNPRFAILFRAGDDLLDHSNGHSAGYKFEGKGTVNQIELIGNKTLTLYGEHRTSGKKYRWNTVGKTLNTKVKKLPVLTIKDVNKIFTYFEQHQPHGWQQSSKRSFSFRTKDTSGDPFENARALKVYTEEQIDEILANSKDYSREGWRDVGYGLNSNYRGRTEGLIKWDEWSQLDTEGYVSYEDCAEQWRSFDPQGPITMQTIERRTIKRELKTSAEVSLTSEKLTAKGVLEEYLYVVAGKLVCRTTGSVENAVRTFDEIKHKWKNQRVKFKKPTGNANESRETFVPLIDIWMNDELRKTAEDVTYVPGKSRIVHNGKFAYYNQYESGEVIMSEDTDLVHHFVDHMRYLFNENFDLAMNWFAQIIQEPSKRYRTALYSISLHEATGRGWMNELFEVVLGKSNVSKPSIGDVTGGTDFNEHAYNKVLAIVSEVKTSDGYVTVSGALKNFLSENTQQINIKNKQKITANIYTRLFLQSNDIDDLIISEEDTRIIVCMNREPCKDPEYYDNLYNLLDERLYPDFANQVYSYLMKWKLNKKWVKGAPLNKDKQYVIEATKSPTALYFYKLKMLLGRNFVDKQEAMNYILSGVGSSNTMFNPTQININKKQLDRLFIKQINSKKIINVQGKRIEVISFHPHNMSKLPDAAIINTTIKSSELLANNLSNLKLTQQEK